MKAVTIKWRDAFQRSKLQTLSDGGNLKTEITITRGFLVSDDPEYVICRDYIPMEQNDFESCGDGYIVINPADVVEIIYEGEY